MEISDRKRMILAAVVTLHTDSGDPVGSNILNRFLDEISVSSATLRNEMAELTALGLLEQPHTSAGRIPTQLGMRFYVDNLMHLYKMAPREKQYIENLVATMDTDPEKAAEAAAKSLANMFELAAIAMTPQVKAPHLVHFEIMRAGRFNLAVMGVTNAGSVKSRICRVADDLSDRELQAAETVLNDHLVFVSSEDVSPKLIAQINALLGDIGDKMLPVISSAVALVRQAADVRVYSDGEHNLLHYREMDGQMRPYLEFLNDSERVTELLSKNEKTVTILMGDEIGDEMPDMGLVVGNYRAWGLSGGLGIAGPSRMNYAYIIPRLKYFCDSMSKYLAE